MNNKKKSNLSEEIEAEIVTINIDLGNKVIKCNSGGHVEKHYSTLMAEDKIAFIGRRKRPDALCNFMYLLGRKINQNQIQSCKKYYFNSLEAAHNQNIKIIIKNNPFVKYVYPQLALSLALKALIPKSLQSSKNKIKIIMSVQNGQSNCHRLSIVHALHLINVNEFLFVSPCFAIAAKHFNFIKQNNAIQKQQISYLGVVDFGDRWFNYQLFKLFKENNLIQCIAEDSIHFGGFHITNKLVDFFVRKLQIDKGMNIIKDQYLMSKLRILCQQAKQTLDSEEMVFIRLDELPDSSIYGCKMSLSQYQKLISAQLSKMTAIIKSSLPKIQGQRKLNLILSGGSKSLIFKHIKQTSPQLCKNLIDCGQDWSCSGLHLVRPNEIIILDICPFTLRMEADEGFQKVLINKGQDIPLRKKEKMMFPKGQLNYSMKFYQNNELMGTFFIPQCPRQNEFDLFIEVDVNKIINIYASTSFGKIVMEENLLTLSEKQLQNSQQMLNDMQLYLQND